MSDRQYFAREPNAHSVIDDWAVFSNDHEEELPDHPICVSVDGTYLGLTIREAKAMRVGLSRAIKEFG